MFEETVCLINVEKEGENKGGEREGRKETGGSLEYAGRPAYPKQALASVRDPDSKNKVDSD